METIQQGENDTQALIRSKEDVARLRPTSTVMQGTMHVRYSGLLSTWQRYHVVLKRTCLVYKRSRSDRRIAGFVNLSKVAVWPGETECGRAYSIMIYHPNRTTHFLAAASSEEARQWILAIRRVKEFLDWTRRDKQEEDHYTSSSDEEHEHSLTCFGKTIRWSMQKLMRRKPRAHDLLFDEIDEKGMDVSRLLQKRDLKERRKRQRQLTEQRRESNLYPSDSYDDYETDSSYEEDDFESESSTTDNVHAECNIAGDDRSKGKQYNISAQLQLSMNVGANGAMLNEAKNENVENVSLHAENVLHDRLQQLCTKLSEELNITLAMGDLNMQILDKEEEEAKREGQGNSAEIDAIVELTNDVNGDLDGHTNVEQKAGDNDEGDNEV